MSDSYGQDVTITSTAVAAAGGWIDLTTIYPAMAGVFSVVQNKGGCNLGVVYSSSATAPTGGDMIIGNGASWGGTAAHVWVKVYGTQTTVSLSLV